MFIWCASTCARCSSTVQVSSTGGELLEKPLGIRRAEGLFVHLAHLRVTSGNRRRWTGLVVALTVTFTACDAQQIGLSSSCGLLSLNRLPFFQTKRPEQKAPQALSPVQILNEALAIRGPFPSSRQLKITKKFQYILAPLTCWSAAFCLRLNSCESPRAPPLMDPRFVSFSGALASDRANHFRQLKTNFIKLI